jgi:hypothetical protein
VHRRLLSKRLRNVLKLRVKLLVRLLLLLWVQGGLRKRGWDELEGLRVLLLELMVLVQEEIRI